MSTVIVAVILMACIVLSCIVFNLLHKRNEEKQKEQLLNNFAEAAAVHGLSLARQEVLRNIVLGLDIWRKSLLVYETLPERNIVCLSLTTIKNCNISKRFDNINTGSDKQPRTEKQLRSIEVSLSFHDMAEPFSLVFYDSNINSLYEMPELEAKAKTWESVLSGLIPVEQKSRA